MKKVTRFICMILVCLVASGMISVGTHAAQPATPLMAETNAKLRGLNPYIYVSGYEIVDGEIKGGETFTLRTHVTNANTQTNAYNVMMSFFFSVENGFYMLEGDTNQRYFPVLSAGETTSVDIKLHIDEGLIEPSVVIEFFFDYATDNKAAYSNTSVISLLPHKKSNMTAVLASLPGEVVAGEETPVTIQCSNNGKTELVDITATLEGDFDGSPMTFEKEELIAGERFIVDTHLVFNQQGIGTVRVRTNYTNAQGTQFETEAQTYELTVADGETQLPSSAQSVLSPPHANSIFGANSFWFYITLASGVLLVGVIAALIVNLARGRKKRN